MFLGLFFHYFLLHLWLPFLSIIEKILDDRQTGVLQARDEWK